MIYPFFYKKINIKLKYKKSVLKINLKINLCHVNFYYFRKYLKTLNYLRQLLKIIYIIQIYFFITYIS